MAKRATLVQNILWESYSKLNFKQYSLKKFFKILIFLYSHNISLSHMSPTSGDREARWRTAGASPNRIHLAFCSSFPYFLIQRTQIKTVDKNPSRTANPQPNRPKFWMQVEQARFQHCAKFHRPTSRRFRDTAVQSRRCESPILLPPNFDRDRRQQLLSNGESSTELAEIWNESRTSTRLTPCKISLSYV